MYVPVSGMYNQEVFRLFGVFVLLFHIVDFAFRARKKIEKNEIVR